ncbi:MAG: glucosidase [Acidobacteria bacterium]|nr:MAG: glucosidase [Acidobacteriota bacterium]
MTQTTETGAEQRRLIEDVPRVANWKRWGPYLSERQWGTVREDYSPYGSCWEYFPHDHARSRVYRWGEDGLLGICDREGRLCFGLALWNGRDPILKERMFGLTNSEGNHGEDVKECYFYLDSTPTHSYMKALYKYPQAAYPYTQLCEENRRRGKHEPEFELQDTGIFDEGRYFDVFAEYAKQTPNDLLIRITVANRGPEAAQLHLLPTLWYRNTWAWGRTGEGYWPRPNIKLDQQTGRLVATHDSSLGTFHFAADASSDGVAPQFLFTNNETNGARLFGGSNPQPYVKDAFHEYVIHGRTDAVNPAQEGTKAAVHYVLNVPANGEVQVDLRLCSEAEQPTEMFGASFNETFATRTKEADEFYAPLIPENLSEPGARAMRQAFASLLWSKQFYHYIVRDWLEGDPSCPPPPRERSKGRNYEWLSLYNRDVVSMPDTWEYPWYASWDLAFHTLVFAMVDPEFAKDQLVMFLREWYMHANGQIPAYEFAFSDANPPVHAWACWRIYKMATTAGVRDRLFLERVFYKLLVNFTWWVNRKDVEGKQIFSGGFLGLDNIGVFDRSKPLPTGGALEQADGTAWMAFYCGTMLSIALELAVEEPEYEDIASKFFEHFVAIVDAMNAIGESADGLWDEEDGFYYDEIKIEGREIPLRIRSMVGLIPLFAVEILDAELIERLPGFSKRMNWFLENRKDLARHISYMEACHDGKQTRQRLLAMPSRERLTRVLRYLLDENEFLSPYGVRSLSRVHLDQPYVLHVDGMEYKVRYDPGDSSTVDFGGNSNWRGPIWFPVNYLLIEALQRYHHFYGDDFRVECPTGSGRMLTLAEVAQELNRRLARIFIPDDKGHAPWQGDDARFARDPHWRELVLFHEYFHGETGRGLGASHQTGWTALVARCLDDLARHNVEAHLQTGG